MSFKILKIFDNHKEIFERRNKMNPKKRDLYLEIKKFIIITDDGFKLKSGAPKEVQEKFKKFNEMEDDEILIDHEEDK